MSPTNTHTPLAQESVQLRPPARYISPLHLLRGRRSACTKRRRPGRAGYIASGPPGGGGNRGTAGAWGRVELTLPPNRFGPEDEGPTGWLLRANVIRDQLGGTSFATAKTRSRMDVRSSQSARERGGPSADGPRSLAVGERKGRGERPCAGVDHSLPHWPEPRSPSAGGPTFSPAMLGEAGPLRASVPLVLEGYLEKTPDRSRWCQPGLFPGPPAPAPFLPRHAAPLGQVGPSRGRRTRAPLSKWPGPGRAFSRPAGPERTAVGGLRAEDLFSPPGGGGGRAHRTALPRLRKSGLPSALCSRRRPSGQAAWIQPGFEMQLSLTHLVPSFKRGCTRTRLLSLPPRGLFAADTPYQYQVFWGCFFCAGGVTAPP